MTKMTEQPKSIVARRIECDDSSATSEITPVQELPLAGIHRHHLTQQAQEQDVSSIWAHIERENDLLKKVEILLEKRIRKENGITRFSLAWFVGLFAVQSGIALFFVFLRGSGYDLSEGATITPMQQVSIFVAFFLGFTLLDAFSMCVCPDRIVPLEERSVAKTHVIVASHRAAHSLSIMLPRVLAIFEPHYIWVADNGYPDEETQILCRQLGVHYRYNPIGNKANALLQCAIEIRDTFAGDADHGTLRAFVHSVHTSRRV
jgi:hypothetical protein